mmetsp:Transcript_5711/g.6544  ORF Transcript_5711/g.6544 Transcript_5711/m.6544 type:complete len:927 (+) Transcript_5711:140-2920(+)|eukprot:CAMPEP_0197858128 /NCGR_PEP_ID=MMETSP1438-20131217/31713_1 /TAXON_ID=1461541 /ORGANISM="Pterosperma sp., Strain CCMP1384" /LENGTH=926 /DNA_ID=CAMNT_0043474191 /DNA_START=121 /DNA_END=2901 /DNA_ORIENTATION=+
MSGTDGDGDPPPDGEDRDNFEDEDSGETEGVSFLPPFANAENKDLDRLIKATEVQLENCEAALEENRDRISIMEEHLRNVKQELVYTQGRVDAKNKEIETEDHLKQINERELGRLRTELQDMDKEELDLQDKLNSVQNQIYRGNEKMDQFKLLMNWNQEELEQWALASRQKEEDNLALQKYSRADEARVKELNLHIEKLTKKVNKKKHELETEVTETQAAQIQLDKTAEDFRTLHNERQQLVQQWEEAVEAMKRRDAAIQAASERFATKKLEIREKQAQLDEKAKFLEQEKANNKEVDARIQLADRGLGKLRAMHNDENTTLLELSDEVDVLRNTLQKSANDLAVQRTNNVTLRTEVEEKRRKLEASRKKYSLVEMKLREEFANLDTMEKKTNELQRLHAQEHDRLKSHQKEVSDLKEQMFKSSQELFNLRTKERDLIAEIAGGQSQNKNLTTKITQLDAQVVRQQELLYNAEFQIQQLERKVARAAGERSDEEKRLLNAKIENLTQQLEEKTAEHSMLSASVKRAEDDLNAARRKNVEQNKDSSALRNKISELQLESDTVLRSVNGAIAEKQDKMVAHDVLKLEVKRLRDILNLRADEVFGLENRKFQLQMSMDERKHEIEVHREVLQAQLKTLQEDMHRVVLELKERELRMHKLQSKYEVLVGKMQPDEGDEERSQAYYVIKAAQEREDLQRQGDQLDAQIRKAEKEVRALEKTLGKLGDKNSMYRNSFKPVGDNDKLQQRAQLRERLDRAYDRMKFKRNEERSLQHDLEHIELRLSTVTQEESTLGNSVEELKKRKSKADSDYQEQLAKATRAKKKVLKLKKELHETKGHTEGDTVEEIDFRLQELKDDNRILLAELRACANVEPSIIAKLEAAGIKLPSASNPPSKAPSVASSRASSAGSQQSDLSARDGTSAGRTVQFQGI